MLRAPTRTLFFPPSRSFRISVYSSSHSREEERISTMPSGCKHHWLVLSMIDRVSQKDDFRNLSSCPPLLASGKSKDGQQCIDYERRPRGEKIYSFDFFLFVFFFFFLLQDDWYIGFIFRHQSVRIGARSIQTSIFSLKGLITTKVYTPFSDLQHCPKNTAILSQILFGFCRLHDYFTFFSLLYIVKSFI